jgi:hypothetical protein
MAAPDERPRGLSRIATQIAAQIDGARQKE